MRVQILRQLAACEQCVDQNQTGGGTVAHRDRRGAIELDHRRWIDTQQHIVKTDDLRPIGRRRVRRFGVDRGDRRLQCVRSDAARRECSLDEGYPFGDLIAVPERPILILEENELVAGGACNAA